MKIKNFINCLLLVSLVFGVVSVSIAEEPPLLTFAKKAKVNWKAAEGKTVHLITPSYHAMDYMWNKQLPIFEELTGIKVVWEFFPPEEAKLKSRIDLMAGAGKIDIPYIASFYLPEYLKGGYLEPFDPYLNNPELTDKEWFNLDDFPLAFRMMATKDGKLHALPPFTEAGIFMYRKDIFQKAGLMVPDTFDDWYVAAQKINNPPELYGTALRGARGPGVIPPMWIPFFRGFGGRFFVDFPRDLTPTVNSPEGVAGTKAYVDLFHFAPVASRNWGWPDKLNALQQGVLGMAHVPPDFVFPLEDPAKSKTAGKWGYAPIPHGPAGRYPYILMMAFGINEKSRNKVASWLFMEFMLCSQAVFERDGTERISAWKKTLMKGEITGMKGPWVMDWGDALTTSFAIADPDVFPMMPEMGEYCDKIGVRVSQAIAGQLDVEAAMDKLQKDFEELFVKK